MPHHDQPQQPEADPAQAKHDIFTTAHEVFGLGYAKPDDVSFWYESCRDNGGPPFQATMTARIKILESWTHDQIVEHYTLGLTRLPGWSNSTGGWKTHNAVITRGNIHFGVPYWTGEKDDHHLIYVFTLDGPCTITQNMKEQDADPNVPKDISGYPGLATDPQDYTKQFE